MPERCSQELERHAEEETIGLLPFDERTQEEPSEKTGGIETTQHNGGVSARMLSCLSAVGHYTTLLLLFFVPSFISALWTNPGPTPAPERVRPTAYLDGLRGVAAWSVFNHHLGYILLKNDRIWGGVLRWPGLQLFYAGSFSVSLFFVISGFALSIGPVAQMKTSPRDPAAAMAKLASAVFRRPMRLLIPAFASSALVFILTRFSYCEWTVERMPVFSTMVDGWGALCTPNVGSFWAQLLDMIRSNGSMLQALQDYTIIEHAKRYNQPLWTIAVELRASFFLFLTHAALYYMRLRSRAAIVAALIVVGVAVKGYDVPLFWAGYLIAEFDKPSADTTVSRLKAVATSAAWWFIFFVGCYMGSYAEWMPQKKSFYSWMWAITPFYYTPDYRFWTGVAAGLVLLSIGKIPLLKRFYTSSLIQYLGKISFSLYLVHGDIEHVVGRVIFYNVWSITGKGKIGGPLGFVVSYFTLLGFAICVADVFWRAVDKPSVSFASKLQKWLFEEA